MYTAIDSGAESFDWWIDRQIDRLTDWWKHWIKINGGCKVLEY